MAITTPATLEVHTVDSKDIIISVRDLKVEFQIKQSFLQELFTKKQKIVKAVDGVSIDIHQGEIVSLVGESGSGKTTLGKAILNLAPKTTGEVLFKGETVDHNNKKELKRFRQKAQMIFQDPYQSLDPKSLIIDTVAEPLEVNNLLKTAAERKEKTIKALEDSGLAPAENYLYRYPYELSGGQRQRVAIAGSIILDPDFIVADEPVSMLDVSVRTGILNLLLELKSSRDLAFLFITHDLSLAWLISDRIAIMYLGKIVEIGSADEIINNCRHPYTRALLSIMPIPEVHRNRNRQVLKGEIPDPTEIPRGCRFNTRCEFAFDKCYFEEPQFTAISDNHNVACHLAAKEQ
jgi:peptide/nickel transport system ATP-binding protein